MTIRNLTAFRPQSVAPCRCIGARRLGGAVILRNVLAGGFEGPVCPINAKHDHVMGLRCYRRSADLPAPPDLAVIMTPPPTVPRIVAELGAAGFKGAVIITAGVDGASGLREATLLAARPHTLRLIGPNTIGTCRRREQAHDRYRSAEASVRAAPFRIRAFAD